MPQPYLVPVRLSDSRRTQSNGISGGTSTCRCLPLTVNESLAPPSGSGAPAEPSSSEPEPRRARRAKAPRSSTSPRGSPTDATSSAIDLNRATAVELTDLPGIGPALARRIVDARDTAGRFARVDELGRVRGMSARKIEQLRAFVTIAE